jgi:HEAT repeat protein
MRTLHALLAGLVCVALVVPSWAAIPKASDVPPLVDQLKKGDAKARANAAKELGHIGAVKKTLVKDAIPLLIEAVKDKDINVRIEAMAALARIGAEPEKVVPMLRENLKGKDDKLIIGSAQALGTYGSASEEALPELKKLAEDNAVPRNNKEAEAKFTREELNKRRAIGRAVGDAMRNIGGRR